MAISKARNIVRGRRMSSVGRRPGRIIRSVLAVGVLVAAASACQPAGWLSGAIGTGSSGNTGDGGLASAAQMVTPGAMAPIPSGGWYVVDESACVIRKVAPNGVMSTVAGNGTCGFTGDNGAATSAEIHPVADPALAAIQGRIALDPAGNLYLADSGNARIRKISPSGTITTVAGDGSGTYPSTCAGASVPAAAVAVAPDGTVYLTCGVGVQSLGSNGTLANPVTPPAAPEGNVTALTVAPNGDIFYAAGLRASVLMTVNMSDTTFPEGLAGAFSNYEGTATDLVVAPGNMVNPTIYAAVSPAPGTSTVPTTVQRYELGTGAHIAGTGSADPGTGVQAVAGADAALTPNGITLASNGTLLISSGHVVYRVFGAASAPNVPQAPPAGCADPTEYHPGGVWSGGDSPGNANISDCDLSNTVWEGSGLANGIMDNSNWRNSTLTSSGFYSESMRNVNFDRIQTTAFAMHSDDATGAFFGLSDLTGAYFGTSTLTNADFSGANLSGATFAGITGEPIGGSTAIYNNTTCPDATVVTSPATCVGHGFAS